MNRLLKLSMQVLVGSVLVPAAASAQASGDTTEVPTVVVTATRGTAALRSHTATVSVLDGAALRAEGVTHLGDALRRVPGLALSRTSSFGSQVALFTRGGQSNYTRVLIDGVPLNEPGGTLDLGRITLDGIERIEVVRGPASVLYGSEAVTGVIQLFTRRGDGRTRVDAEIGGGSYGAQRAALGVSGGIGRIDGAADGARESAAGGRPPVIWSLRGDHHASNGILAFNNAYRNDGLVASVGTTPGSPIADVRLTARYNGSLYEFPTGSDGTPEDRNARRTVHRLMLGLDAARRWSERVDTRVQLSSSEFRPRDDDGPDDAADTVGFYGYHARATVRRFLADSRTTVRVGDDQYLTVGGEVGRDTERGSALSLSEFGDSPSSFRAARDNAAIYAQAMGDAGAVSYTLGGRLDDNSAFGTFHTMRAGLAWRVGAATRVRASAGNAFKAPSFFENFAEGFTVGNPALRPERTRSAELGVETVLGSGASVRVTGFTQRFTDLIQYTGAPPSAGEPNFYNIAAANAGGVEVEASFPAVAGFAVSTGYTWTDTRVVDAGFDAGASANFVEGGRLLRRPEQVLTALVTRPLGDVGHLSLLATHTGEREDRDFGTFPASVVFLDPYTTVDVSAELTAVDRLVRGATLLLRVENAANVRYRAIAGFDTPGRTLSVALKLRR